METETLHCDNMIKNPYINTLRTIKRTVDSYNENKSINIFGFGGILPGRKKNFDKYDVFALNGNIFNPSCENMDAVLGAYNNAIKVVKPHNHVRVDDILDHIKDYCIRIQKNEINDEYNVLLLFQSQTTKDGERIAETMVEISEFPLTVIVIGVNPDANYEVMGQID